MKTNEEIQEEYKANPEKWIPLWRFPTLESPYQKRWTKVLDDVNYIRNNDTRAEYKLIHIRHKEVLDAWLEDNNVEIEQKSNVHQGWIEDSNFIENYQEWLEYRLEEKKDEHSRTSGDTDTTMDNSVDSDNVVSKMTIPIIEVDEEMDIEIDEYLSKQDGYRSELDLDTFTAHGFEVPDFEGEILKEVDGYYVGYVITKSKEVMPVRWCNKGYTNGSLQILGFYITPIKKEWYEYPDNFPAMCIWENSSGGDGLYIFGGYYDGYFMDSDGETHQANLYRLATKAELMSLYYKED